MKRSLVLSMLVCAGAVGILFAINEDPAGNVGIRTDFPTKDLTIHGGTGDAYIDFASSLTGPTNPGGWRSGMAKSGKWYYIWGYQNNGSFGLGTANKSRWDVTAIGDLRTWMADAEPVIPPSLNVTSQYTWPLHDHGPCVPVFVAQDGTKVWLYPIHHVPSPGIGGDVVDLEARAAIDELRRGLISHGFMADSPVD